MFSTHTDKHTQRRQKSGARQPQTQGCWRSPEAQRTDILPEPPERVGPWRHLYLAQ